MILYTFRSLLVATLVTSITSLHAESPESINIGSLTALTGNAATQGVPCKNAFLVSLARRNELANKKQTQINLTIGDTQRSAAPAVTEFTQMLSSQNLIGAAIEGSPVGMAINPLSLKNQIPIVGAVGHRDFTTDNKFAFSMWPSTEAEGSAIAKGIMTSNHSKIAVISVEDDYTLSVRDSFVAALSSSSIDIIANVEVQPKEINFSSILLKIRSKNPDAIFVNTGFGQSGIVVKKIRELGMKVAIYANFLASTVGEIESAGPAAEGMINTQVDFDKKKLSEIFKKYEYPLLEPTTLAYTCLVSMEFILQSVDASQGLVSTPDELYQSLLKQEKVEVLDEQIPIKNRRAIYKFRKQIFKSGKWEPML